MYVRKVLFECSFLYLKLCSYICTLLYTYIGHTKETKEVVYEDVDSKEVHLLQPNPSYVTVSSPLSSSGLSGQVQGPVYEECEMRDRVVIEENPAYGALTKPTEYSNL